MKTIQKDNEIQRVSNEVADTKVGSAWKYVPKSLWKEQVRGKSKQETKEASTVAEKQLKHKKITKAI